MTLTTRRHRQRFFTGYPGQNHHDQDIVQAAGDCRIDAVSSV